MGQNDSGTMHIDQKTVATGRSGVRMCVNQTKHESLLFSVSAVIEWNLSFDI